MKRSSAFVPALVLAASAVSVQTQTQTVVVQGGTDGQAVFAISGQPPGMPMRDNRPVKTGTAKIRGRVVAGDTGQPLRKAQVRIFSPEIRENRLASTDAQGAYEFKDLPADTPASIRAHVKAFDYPVHAVRDPDHDLVSLARAVVTPEAAVFGRHRQLLYHGRIDDRYVSIAVERPAATVHDLENAIAATLAGTSVHPVTMPAVGCYIADFI